MSAETYQDESDRAEGEVVTSIDAVPNGAHCHHGQSSNGPKKELLTLTCEANLFCRLNGTFSKTGFGPRLYYRILSK